MQRKLRSAEWWSGNREYYNFSRRAWLRSEGFSHQIFEGKPVIGICNSWSELNNCNLQLRVVAEAVKRGVWAAGGVPLEFPTISLGEMFMRPTAMMYRNLMAMDVEESIRANPLDGVVLLSGCDKTVPAQLMGAASANIPSILVPSGPMLPGHWRGRELGAGTDGRKLFDLYRAGHLSEEELHEAEGCLARTAGTCGVMGTASTMACMAEALGMSLPGCAAIPAVDARRLAIAEESGRRMVAVVDQDLTPSRIMTPAAFERAITVLMALGGSTNAVVHLIAIAGRLGIPLPLEDFDRISKHTPTLVNVKPSGEHTMVDFFYAGGVPAVLAELANKPLPHTDRTVIRAIDNPLHAEGGIAVLRGNLAPSGALIKQTAASPHLLRHRGRAFVFESHDEMLELIDRDDLPVTADTILVMKNAGPIGGPGFPEWGQIPIPRVLLKQGVTDMVRISDARMSGTSFGTVVLHVSPESAVGGPLASVRTGDEIELDVVARSVNLLISDDELQRRLAGFHAPAPQYSRGYGSLFLAHVLQANEGCDFDFLRLK